MRWVRVLLILIMLISISSTVLSSTLARFSTGYSGFDTGLVTKWNFGARGDEDEEFYNKGFTFDLFSAQSVEPMQYGAKSFTFTGGGSDVGIVYDVEMNVGDLLGLVTGTVAEIPEVDIYAPFIFKITVEAGAEAVDPPPLVFIPADADDDGWFRPADLKLDDNGFFSIFDAEEGKPYFSPGSEDQVAITVHWQWNTSFYINDTEAASINPDASVEAEGGLLSYYQEAYEEFYGSAGLAEKLWNASQAIEDYLEEHGSPSDDETWIHYLSEETEELCPADHFTEYNQLVAAEHQAYMACRVSLMAAYDDYDTLAMDALVAKEVVKVVFRITGEQMEPQ